MIRNEDIRGKVRVILEVDKMRKAELTWFRHVKRKSIYVPVKRGERLTVIGLMRGKC